MSGKPATRLRLMPTVIMATAALLALKTIEFATHSSYLFSTPAAAAGSAKSHDEKPEGKPAPPKDEAPSVPDDHGKAESSQPSTTRPKENPPVDNAGQLATEASSQGALIEALSKRREAIDARSAQLDDREQLLKAAEKRMEDRIAELKRLEAAISEADKRKADEESGKLKELVTMYENMKPKEAARIFEKLDPEVLLDVASRMKPRQLSVILGLMAPDAAQKLTVSLARRQVAPQVADAMDAADLPKIQGKPTPR